MSQGRKKSPEVQDANLFHKIGLTSLRLLHWLQDWQGCWGTDTLFQAGKASAGSVLYKLVWQSEGYMYEDLALAVFYFFPLLLLEVITSVFSPALVKPEHFKFFDIVSLVGIHHT